MFELLSLVPSPISQILVPCSPVFDPEAKLLPKSFVELLGAHQDFPTLWLDNQPIGSRTITETAVSSDKAVPTPRVVATVDEIFPWNRFAPGE